jgi:hypothetical protein
VGILLCVFTYVFCVPMCVHMCVSMFTKVWANLALAQQLANEPQDALAVYDKALSLFKVCPYVCSHVFICVFLRVFICVPKLFSC